MAKENVNPTEIQEEIIGLEFDMNIDPTDDEIKEAEKQANSEVEKEDK